MTNVDSVAPHSFVKSRQIRLMVTIGAVLLTSACGNIEYFSMGDNKYVITGRSSLGALGGDPSDSQIAKKAAELCRNGYDIVDKNYSTSEGQVNDWTVKCK